MSAVQDEASVLFDMLGCKAPAIAFPSDVRGRKDLPEFTPAARNIHTTIRQMMGISARYGLLVKSERDMEGGVTFGFHQVGSPSARAIEQKAEAGRAAIKHGPGTYGRADRGAGIHQGDGPKAGFQLRGWISV